MPQPSLLAPLPVRDHRALTPARLQRLACQQSGALGGLRGSEPADDKDASRRGRRGAPVRWAAEGADDMSLLERLWWGFHLRAAAASPPLSWEGGWLAAERMDFEGN